ncbi:carbon-nitrogen hydrolase [uncultured Helicobacter sp.]|uniref:carbon-nitrogen hydrolase n=1 Tax=uncultured Helicobacter sp. TaxID=175537 RepID=UPI00374FB2C4
MPKVALIQQAYNGSREASMEHTKKAILEAANNGAQLVCLQELHTREYFCQCEDPVFFDYAHNFADDVAYFSDVAKQARVVLVSSLFEKRTAGMYHNTAVVFESNGEIAGKYRKMHIPDDPQFYEKFYFTPGDLGFEPIDTSVGRLGVLVCWDQWYPEAARIMALKGADMLIYPTAIGWFDEDSEAEKTRQLEAWIAVQRGHSVANGLPVVAINRVGFEPCLSFAQACEFWNGDLQKKEFSSTQGIRFWGNSFAFGAQGELLAQADSHTQHTLLVDIDFKRSEEVRRMWPFLRDRRIEAFDPLLKRFCD